jgi:serine/threonine protein kinase
MGKGGFGAVYPYEDKAIKILRVDKSNMKLLDMILDEIIISKKLTEADTSHEHVAAFFSCHMLGDFISEAVDALFKPPTMSQSFYDKKLQEKSFIYVGIVMEKLQKNLFWFLNNYSSQMDLLERSRLAMNLADHLNFLNNTVKKSHCDVKPDNFMLNQEFYQPNAGEGVVSAMTLLMNDMQIYRSKMIDFGGIVHHTLDKCKTYTPGFVPFDDILKNGANIHPDINSSKNDVFAFGTILAYIITKDRPLDLMKMNISIHHLLKNINDVENKVYINRAFSEPKQLRQEMKDFGWQGVRNVTILKIAPDIIQQFGDLLQPLKDTWKIISNQEELEDNKFIEQIYSSTDYFISLLETLYQSYFISIKEDRKLMAKFEMMRLLASYGFDIGNYDDYVKDVMEYVSFEEKFVELVMTTFSFVKDNRPEWNVVIEGFSEIEAKMTKLFDKIDKAKRKDKSKKFRGVDSEVYKTFMDKVADGSIVLLEELNETHSLRILNGINNETSHQNGDSNSEVAKNLMLQRVASQTQKNMVKYIDNMSSADIQRSSHGGQTNINKIIDLQLQNNQKSFRLI